MVNQSADPLIMTHILPLSVRKSVLICHLRPALIQTTENSAALVSNKGTYLFINKSTCLKEPILARVLHLYSDYEQGFL